MQTLKILLLKSTSLIFFQSTEDYVSQIAIIFKWKRKEKFCVKVIVDRAVHKETKYIC